MKINYKITTIILAIILAIYYFCESFGYGMMGYSMHNRFNVMMGRGSYSDCIAWANATDGGRAAGSYNEYCNKKLTNGSHIMSDGQMMSNDMMSSSSMMKGDNSSMDNMMMDMTVGMKGKTGKALEKVFLSEMIVHHQGAVDMAKALLADKTIKPQLRTFAEKIIAAQNPEIQQMGVWLKSY